MKDPVTGVLDVRDRAAVEDFARRATARADRLDVWANVAGVLRAAPVAETTEETLDLVLGVNLKGTWFGCAAAGRNTAGQGSGCIVNTASAGADTPAPGLGAYAPPPRPAC
ncbi:SDR family oxidoreductase [Streptomyces antnestii]|uniref:SDR family oxidoreductase n=1 Tax=Streptomyces antnestii TaxID=2494256 RepID=UPI0026B55514|nr:SDR family oxidoreductase [Streptomyces sp. San01]